MALRARMLGDAGDRKAQYFSSRGSETGNGFLWCDLGAAESPLTLWNFVVGLSARRLRFPLALLVMTVPASDTLAAPGATIASTGKTIISDKLAKHFLGYTFAAAFEDQAFRDKILRYKALPPSASPNFYELWYYFKSRAAEVDFQSFFNGGAPTAPAAETRPPVDALVPFAPAEFKAARPRGNAQARAEAAKLPHPAEDDTAFLIPMLKLWWRLFVQALKARPRTCVGCIVLMIAFPNVIGFLFGEVVALSLESLCHILGTGLEACFGVLCEACARVISSWRNFERKIAERMHGVVTLQYLHGPWRAQPQPPPMAPPRMHVEPAPADGHETEETYRHYGPPHPHGMPSPTESFFQQIYLAVIGIVMGWCFRTGGTGGNGGNGN